MITRTNLTDALPDMTGNIVVQGLDSKVTIYRDRFGIPHVQAKTTNDAFYGQGFATAQDRLWHMDFDRHRAYGRWAELVGTTGIDEDVTMRSFQIEASAKADYDTINLEAKRMLDAYASGVNAFIIASHNLPVEYTITTSYPEAWQPWDCLAVLKVRHIMMGTFESKIWRARLLNLLGTKKVSHLYPGYEKDHLLILPPGINYKGSVIDSLTDLENAATAISGFESDMGSNNWVLSGKHTSTGKPLMAGDPHRGLDTPNVYYQNHVACQDFDVVGVSFPGSPGFPHFGHNHWVCWGVTHTGADYQDLFIEQFKDNGVYYKFQGRWLKTDLRQEILKVKGGKDRELTLFSTHHGPVIAGNPLTGSGITFMYTQTAGVNKSAEALFKMLKATSTIELDQSMFDWVDPVNNFVFADLRGNIGYLTRGQIPIRSRTNAWVPVPGWTGDHEWQGNIPFRDMPRLHNPEIGYIVTANQKVTDDDYPHFIALDHAPEYRARRITSRLQTLSKASPDDMADIHSERISIPAQKYIEFLKAVDPEDTQSEEAKSALLAWDGDMDRESIAATIYSSFRVHLDGLVLSNLLGPLAEEALTGSGRGGPAHVSRLRSHFLHLINKNDDNYLTDGQTWAGLMRIALSMAMKDLTDRLGPNITTWKWGNLHKTKPQHTLTPVYPELGDLLDPPSIPMGGDGDTPQNASYSPGHLFDISSTSVLRYVYDLSNWDNSKWIVPLGASGHPGSDHYADQASIWGDVELIPMLYNWDIIVKESESSQILESH